MNLKEEHNLIRDAMGSTADEDLKSNETAVDMSRRFQKSGGLA